MMTSEKALPLSFQPGQNFVGLSRQRNGCRRHAWTIHGNSTTGPVLGAKPDEPSPKPLISAGVKLR
jgi:hypothetical protein